MLPLSGLSIKKNTVQTEAKQNIEARKREKDRFIKLGFPQEVNENHPECMSFLLKSGIAFAIAMFKNNSKAADECHALRLDYDGHPLIKMKNNWQRWEHIQSIITYDEENDELISKGDPAIKWNYISPEGIVQKGMYTYDELYPVEQISQEEYSLLLKHSKKLWDTIPEIDVGEEKDCIIQIVTTDNTPTERDWLNNNFFDNVPGHVGLRIVENTGKVYSFGVVFQTNQSKIILGNMPFNFLTTGKIKIATYDYEETRSFQARRVTSIPLTTARKNCIVATMGNWNKEDIRFNFARQNCTKFATIVLQMAGITVETRTTLAELVGRILPDLPPVAKEIGRVVTSAFEVIRTSIPTPASHFFSLAYETVSFIPKKLGTLVSNLLPIICGGAKMTCPLPEGKEDHLEMNDNELIDFKSLIRSPLAMFDDTISEFYHSTKLVEWQKKQASTVTYSFEGLKMYMLPVYNNSF